MESTDRPVRFIYDYRSLQKGDILEKSALEIIFSVNFEADQYKYVCELNNFKRWLESKLNSIGNPLHVVQEDFQLRVLTDQEAFDYDREKYAASVNNTLRITSKLATVNRSNLPFEERCKYDNELAMQNFVNRQMINNRRSFKAAPDRKQLKD